MCQTQPVIVHQMNDIMPGYSFIASLKSLCNFSDWQISDCLVQEDPKLFCTIQISSCSQFSMNDKLWDQLLEYCLPNTKVVLNLIRMPSKQLLDPCRSSEFRGVVWLRKIDLWSMIENMKASNQDKWMKCSSMMFVSCIFHILPASNKSRGCNASHDPLSYFDVHRWAN